MILSTFVANYVPLELRHGRDFTGGRGWCHLANTILRRMAAEGFVDLSFQKELPVFVDSIISRDITLPADFLRIVNIHDYSNEDKFYYGKLINGKYRLDEEYTDGSDIEKNAFAFTVAAGAPEDPTPYATCLVADPFLPVDAYNGMNAVFVTSGEIRVIVDTLKVGVFAVFPKITWADAITTAPVLQANIKIINGSNLLMMRYFAKFTDMTAQSDTIPLDDRFNIPLASGMCWLATMGGDKRSAMMWKQQHEDDLATIAKSVFTPSQEDARPQPRPWPTFSNTAQETHEWSGE